MYSIILKGFVKKKGFVYTNDVHMPMLVLPSVLILSIYSNFENTDTWNILRPMDEVLFLSKDVRKKLPLTCSAVSFGFSTNRQAWPAAWLSDWSGSQAEAHVVYCRSEGVFSLLLWRLGKMSHSLAVLVECTVVLLSSSKKSPVNTEKIKASLVNTEFYYEN